LCEIETQILTRKHLIIEVIQQFEVVHPNWAILARVLFFQKFRGNFDFFGKYHFDHVYLSFV
jgi:hypothetical protein